MNLADPCSLMNNMGNGTQTHIRFFFDTNTGRCREFVYSGEGGNDNRFDSLQECKKVCLGATHTLPPSTSGLKKLNSELQSFLFCGISLFLCLQTSVRSPRKPGRATRGCCDGILTPVQAAAKSSRTEVVMAIAIAS